MANLTLGNGNGTEYTPADLAELPDAEAKPLIDQVLVIIRDTEYRETINNAVADGSTSGQWLAEFMGRLPAEHGPRVIIP